MATLVRFYGFSFIFALICLALGVWYGLESTGSLAAMGATDLIEPRVAEIPKAVRREGGEKLQDKEHAGQSRPGWVASQDCTPVVPAGPECGGSSSPAASSA